MKNYLTPLIYYWIFNTLQPTINYAINYTSIIINCQSFCFWNITDYLEIHVIGKSNEQTTKEALKWVHIAISNAKINFAGTYHKIKAKHLQLYLNEFVYKLNRRYLGDRLFDRLVIAGITATERIYNFILIYFHKCKFNSLLLEFLKSKNSLKKYFSNI